MVCIALSQDRLTHMPPISPGILTSFSKMLFMCVCEGKGPCVCVHCVSSYIQRTIKYQKMNPRDDASGAIDLVNSPLLTKVSTIFKLIYDLSL